MLTELKKSNTKIHFIKVKEDFNCENCGFHVFGNGYTNQCPNCLYSKHVDQNIPGDRASECRGLMKPVEYFKRGDQVYLVHKCILCGKIANNKLADNDSLDAMLIIR